MAKDTKGIWAVIARESVQLSFFCTFMYMSMGTEEGGRKGSITIRWEAEDGKQN